jgi:dCMP deaminase
MSLLQPTFSLAAQEVAQAAWQRQTKWDLRFLKKAKEVSLCSKDPSTQTGAIITTQDNLLVMEGFNGLPRGVADLDERLNNRELKYEIIVHCEVNAIVLSRRDLTGCTLYTWPFMSCSRCAGIVIQAGIKRCVAPQNDNPRWQAAFVLSKTLFQEAGVKLDLFSPDQIPFLKD